MRKVIFIGETGCGKTSLSQWLQNKEQVYHKTQQVYYFDDSIDTPGEFMENRFYYNALVSAAVDAQIVAFVQSIKGTQNYFPPFFSSRFTKPIIGIISKIDLAEEEQMILQAKKRLRLAGAKEIFEVSIVTEEGLEALEEYLFQ
ncbi:ethanolamine utilization protein EutP [Enterococcus florum]|uniref:Ethanolamine utilization protein EutP n=1 Tax=Enterococcus florum TaxID=2480627 RepID=A0A4P5PEV0_9ENTE|nr:EutP/PduV family microcompartment system protein [Enterococcus florum]GCF95224.1 ethanolamine utilization protein EutP [Enterococcus florum]